MKEYYNLFLKLTTVYHNFTFTNCLNMIDSMHFSLWKFCRI